MIVPAGPIYAASLACSDGAASCSRRDWPLPSVSRDLPEMRPILYREKFVMLSTKREIHTDIWYTFIVTNFSFIGHLLTYLLTSWSRVPLEKLTGSQLVKKFPTFYGTSTFITAFTSARHLSLSWAFGHTKVSVKVRGFLCKHFVAWYVFTATSC